MNKRQNGSGIKAYIVRQRYKPSARQTGTTDQCGPLACSRTLVKFYMSKSGETRGRAVYLQNSGNLPVGYSIDCECVTLNDTSVISSTFPLIFGQRSGHVPAKSRILLLFGFYPSFDGFHVRKLEITTPGQLPINLLLVGYYGETEIRKKWSKQELLELTRWQGSLTNTDAINTYFERIFEGFVIWDEQKSNEADVRVPDLVTVKCWGHTYQNLSLNDPPSVVITPSSAKFHALALDSDTISQRLAFSNVMLSNLSDDLPLSYLIEFSSRSPEDAEMEYSWVIPEDHAEVLDVSPKFGTIAAESNQSFVWSFAPTTADRDSTDVIFECTYAASSDAEVFYFLPGSPEATKRRTLTIIMTSEEGVLGVKDSFLDLGPIAVGTSVVRSITLLNLTSGSQLLAITVEPSAAKTYECSVNYSCPAWDAQGRTGDKFNEEEKRNILTTVCFRGVYPTIRFTDVVVEGPPPKLGRYRAWRELHLNRINECLQAHPTATERAQSTDMRTSSRFSLLPTFEIQLGVAPQCDGSKPSNRQLKELRGTQNGLYYGGPDAQAFLQHHAASANELYSFLVAQERSGSTQVFLRLENNGSVPAEVQFLFPSQLRPPRENWLEMAYISETTKEQVTVQPSPTPVSKTFSHFDPTVKTRCLGGIGNHDSKGRL
nr:unnamed protein product [Spirometra erinaceieuropaei]